MRSVSADGSSLLGAEALNTWNPCWNNTVPGSEADPRLVGSSGVMRISSLPPAGTFCSAGMVNSASFHTASDAPWTVAPEKAWKVVPSELHSSFHGLPERMLSRREPNP